MNFRTPGSRAVLAALAGALALAAQTVPPELTLDAAVELALAHRHELAAAEAAVRVREGLEAQAALRPNPTFTFQSENWRGWQTPGFSPRNDLDLFAYVTDTIETAGKRRLRTAVAATGTAAAELERRALEWRLRAGVSQAWWRAAGAARRRDLLAAGRETLQELLRYQQTRFELGAAAEIDVLKVSAEDERFAAAVASADAEAQLEKMALLTAMGLANPRGVFDVAAPQALESDAPQAAVGDAVRLALEARPDLALERARVTAAEAALELARAQAKPNLTPYFGYKKSGPFSTLIGGVTVPLPVRNRNQGGIAAALAEADRAAASVRALEARIAAEVRAAAADAERRRAIAESIKTGVRAGTAETYRIARAAYQEQGVDLLYVLDAQRALNEVELLHAQSLLDYWLSRERLGVATGYGVPTGGNR